MVVFEGMVASVNSGTGLALGPNQSGEYFTYFAFMFKFKENKIRKIEKKFLIFCFIIMNKRKSLFIY